MADIKKLLANTDPVFVLFLGTAPAVALTGNIKSALGIGIAALVVMLLSSVVMALIGRFLTDKARIGAGILVTAFFVSVVQQLYAAFLPVSYGMMGVYLAVLAVNLMVFGVSNENECVGCAAKKAFLTGIYFLVAVMVLAGVRVLFGSGVLGSFKIPILTTVHGGLILFAVELAVIRAISLKRCVKEEA